MKNAYIYVTPENYPEGSKNGASSIFEGHTIHIFPGHVSIKTCNICGLPLHASNECDDKNFITDKNNRKIFKKRFIDRKEEKITINEQSKNKYNHVISLNSNNNTSTSPQNIRRTQLQTGIQNHRQQSESLLYLCNGQQQCNITGNDMNNYKRDHMYNTPHPNQPHVSSDNDTNQQITQLELQVKQLLNKIKTMEKEKSNTDTKISNINHNYDTLESSITDVKSRLDKYDSILQQLTNNITILSEKVTTTPKRPSKVVKRTTPYDKTSYDATKAKYNLRSNKQARVSADNSETFPPTDEDTDLHDDAVMSDGAVFEGIIQPDTDNHISEKQFSVKSYNPLNLLSSFNASTSR
ncbi:hypothetical protein RhiirC2_769562 [Rhizophagus irregularis]|uniref:Uncharacterized protein n=1 Tax=Rhizophagus irregularis TaxID=588596 RepID=A0A2N1NYL1_9GLOM|nr:hypothetical protein RhiirC2_769562 [Rhizophagus irregularis]